MNDEITNIPKIRFKGYTEEWEQRKWYDTVNISTDMVDPKEGKYDDLPHIGPGNIESFTGRILNNVKTVREDNLISGKFHFNYGDIIYGKINPQLAKYAYVNFEGLTSADTYVLNSHNGIDQYFLFVILQTKDFYKYSVSVSMRTGMPKINRDELNQYNYLAPSNIDEQRKIGTFFKQLDDTIALHQRELDLLRKTKQTYLQKMFPKAGEDRPEIRFAGFTEPWEQRKLNNYLETSRIKNINGIYDKNDVLSVSGDYGIVNQIKFQGRSFAGVSVAQYGVVENGDIVYTKSPLKSNPFGIIKTNKGKVGIVSTLYAVYKTKENCESIFVQYYFENNDRLNRYLKPLVNKGAKNDMKVSDDNALIGNVVFPSLVREQRKISNFFAQLDNTITLHQRNLNVLKEMKKSLLRQMFV